MTDDDTYDIEIGDVSTDEFAFLATGLSLLQIQLAQAEQLGQETRADVDEVEHLITRLMTENPEAARSMVLTAQEAGAPSHSFQLSADLLETLGLKRVGGEFVEADDWDDIEVE